MDGANAGSRLRLGWQAARAADHPGWLGHWQEDDTNPIFLARLPSGMTCSGAIRTCQLQASGEAVGLQAGKAGNSEAGHMNIGAGRVVLQDDVRLDQAMKDGSFFTNEVFLQHD